MNNTQSEEKKVLNLDFNKVPEPLPKKVNPFLAYLKSNGWMFGLVAALFTISYFTMNYEKEHPITCDSQGTVKELISIEGHYANLKLQDDTTVKYQISRSTKSGSSYGPGIKPNDVICLAYSRK